MPFISLHRNQRKTSQDAAATPAQAAPAPAAWLKKTGYAQQAGALAPGGAVERGLQLGSHRGAARGRAMSDVPEAAWGYGAPAMAAYAEPTATSEAKTTEGGRYQAPAAPIGYDAPRLVPALGAAPKDAKPGAPAAAPSGYDAPKLTPAKSSAAKAPKAAAQPTSAPSGYDTPQLSSASPESAGYLSTEEMHGLAAPGALMAPGGGMPTYQPAPTRNPLALMHASSRDALRESRLAAMREASDDELFMAPRIGLKEREEDKQGWALLPMLRDGRYLDDEEEQFKVVYHYKNAQQAAAKTKHASAQDGNRADFVMRLENGRFVDAGGGLVDTTSEKVPNATLNTALADLDTRLKLERGKGATNKEKKNELRRIVKEGGRYIFVMNSAGKIFGGKNIATVQHHSSFLAGGAVAGAGDMVIAGGEVKVISNMSGHYKPGPAYLWQVVKQLAMEGVNLEAVQIEVMGLRGKFENAAEFMNAIDPSRDGDLFNAGSALNACERYLRDKRKAERKGARARRG